MTCLKLRTGKEKFRNVNLRKSNFVSNKWKRVDALWKYNDVEQQFSRARCVII
jgi:hypothetical protein